MKKLFLLSVFVLMFGFSALAQQPPSASQNQALTEEMVDASVKFDQKRFNLTPEQTVQDRKVLTEYQAQSNAISKNKYQSADQLKAAVKKASLSLAQGYKSFLTPEQYNHFLTTYNKLHPNAQIQ